MGDLCHVTSAVIPSEPNPMKSGELMTEGNNIVEGYGT